MFILIFAGIEPEVARSGREENGNEFRVAGDACTSVQREWTEYGSSVGMEVEKMLDKNKNYSARWYRCCDGIGSSEAHATWRHSRRDVRLLPINASFLPHMWPTLARTWTRTHCRAYRVIQNPALPLDYTGAIVSNEKIGMRHRINETRAHFRFLVPARRRELSYFRIRHDQSFASEALANQRKKKKKKWSPKNQWKFDRALIFKESFSYVFHRH